MLHLFDPPSKRNEASETRTATRQSRVPILTQNMRRQVTNLAYVGLPFRSVTAYATVIARGDPMPAPARGKVPPIETLSLEERIRHRPTNSTSKEEINPARNWTTGSKPKRKFAEPKKRPATKTDTDPFRTLPVRCTINQISI